LEIYNRSRVERSKKPSHPVFGSLSLSQDRNVLLDIIDSDSAVDELIVQRDLEFLTRLDEVRR